MKRREILDLVIGALRAVPGVDGGVREQPFKTIPKTSLPLLVVRPTVESVERDTLRAANEEVRTLTVAIEVVSTVAADRDGLSELVEETMKDLDLANVPISLEEIDFDESDEGSQSQVLAAIHSYVIKYTKDND